MKGRIFSIKRFAVHDGPGIRTTIFFKGCPLRCKWCHNPEGLTPFPQIAYYEKKCLRCMECVRICPSGAHVAEGGEHLFFRDKCKGCGRCEGACLGNALTFYGKETAAKELLPLLLGDQAFFASSGGGVTVSGGEPLLQVDFAAALLQSVKEKKVHTAVDTCGFVPRASIEKVLPYTDIFLYDLKHIDCEKHKMGTGKPNGPILDNLRFLNEKGKKIEIRYPLIPGFNDDEEVVSGAAEFLKTLKSITGVRVLPYHKLAGSKYKALGMESRLPEKLLADGKTERTKEIFSAYLRVLE